MVDEKVPVDQRNLVELLTDEERAQINITYARTICLV